MTNDEYVYKLLKTDRLKIDFEKGLVYSKTVQSYETPIGGQNPYGYLRAGFSLNGKPFWIMLHRLIWISAFGIPKHGMTVDHINGIKTDNRLSNLRLLTLSDNLKESWKDNKRFMLSESQQDALKFLEKYKNKWFVPKNVKIKHKVVRKDSVLFNLFKKGLIRRRRRDIHRYYILQKPAAFEYQCRG